MPATPARPKPEAHAADAARAIVSVSRLVAAADGPSGLQQVRDSLVAEARELLDVEYAALFALKDGGRRAIAVAGDAHGGLRIDEDPMLARLAIGRARVVPLPGDAGAAGIAGSRLVGEAVPVGSALAIRLPLVLEEHLLVIADPRPECFGDEVIAIVEALMDAAAQALIRGRAADVDARRAARQSALTRAAKTLNTSLDLETVLRRICQEATRILDGDSAAIYRAHDDLVMEAGFGLASEVTGLKLAVGQGLAGKVLSSGRPMLTNDYQRISDLAPNGPFSRIRSCMAVPMRWGGDVRGVLAVGYVRPFEVTEELLAVLETFGELAVVACTNASAHAGLALAARTDGLTGCLNHAALHESLEAEIERAERSGDRAVSLVMLDLDDFKSVNELHGHQVGDEVLRRAGYTLRQMTRPYDVAARYGGDEFVLLSVETDEEEAQEIAHRAIDRIGLAIVELCPGGPGRPTAGVAEWKPGMTSTELIARADCALLRGKHDGGRGSVTLSSDDDDACLPSRIAVGAESSGMRA